ncbi:ABC transporter permease [Chloroflexota bacterium]
MRLVPAVPMVILALVVLVAVFAPVIAPHSPVDMKLSQKLQPPFWTDVGSIEYPLGTDKFGRDVLSRLFYGARISLIVGLVAIFFSAAIGTIIGIAAGYFGGLVDAVLMRIVDIGLSIPLILVAILMAVVVGPSLSNVILILAVLLWPRFARQIRGEALSVKENDFVAYARVAGRSPAWIMSRHIFPNVIPTLLVLSSLQVGYVIILESSLSFLGVGIPPPEPAWGVMVADGRGFLATAWWISFFAGFAILSTVLSLNLLGDWIRDRLDPKLRHV